MNRKPQCILVSGRPGSGKTTLAGELSRRLYLPKVSRDEIKEGYVNTFGVKHDRLPEDTNSRVNEVFFETVLGLLKGSLHATPSSVLPAGSRHVPSAPLCVLCGGASGPHTPHPAPDPLARDRIYGCSCGELEIVAALAG